LKYVFPEELFVTVRFPSKKAFWLDYPFQGGPRLQGTDFAVISEEKIIPPLFA
jgi:hypothetical protein